jgi:DDE superfamily endonuclease
MFRIIRVPAVLDKLFAPLRPHFHWNHWRYFRLLVLAMACMWGRRNVTNLYRYLEVEHHRTRFNNFFLVERWDPAAALRQKAHGLWRALRPRKGETLYLIIDDSKHAKRGRAMEAVAKMKDPTTDAYVRGHQYVCAILVYRDHVLPFGIRLYVKKADCPSVGVPFHKTTELAAQLIRECTPPAGVKVMVLFDAYSLCPTVVKACREQHVHFASTLKSHRSLFKQGWKLHAGRYGRNLFRRRRTNTLDLAKPYGPVRYRLVDAGWLGVSKLGPLHVVFSQKGTTNKILGVVTDDPRLSAADVIRTYDKRWTIEQWLKDVKQLLGLGHYQNRPYWAAVTHLHLVCFAYALLTHLRIERIGAQGQRTRHKAANLSTAVAQDQLRRLLWEDLITYCQEQCPEQPVIEKLERLRVA